jgi:hypothetical protein
MIPHPRRFIHVARLWRACSDGDGREDGVRRQAASQRSSSESS